ncbi:CSC1-like protein, partial [Drosera capensis]
MDKLSMGHVKERSPRLWAFVVGVYWVSLVSYYMLWNAYKHVSDLRAIALKSHDFKPEQYAVVIRDIPAAPKGQTIKDQV